MEATTSNLEGLRLENEALNAQVAALLERVAGELVETAVRR
jgi:hypothetical protein